MPADAQALAETSLEGSSTVITRYVVTVFLGAGVDAGVVAVGAAVVAAGMVIELGVPTSVGVSAVLVVVSFLSPRVAMTAQVMPATKIMKAIIKANRTVLVILAV